MHIQRITSGGKPYRGRDEGGLSAPDVSACAAVVLVGVDPSPAVGYSGNFLGRATWPLLEELDARLTSERQRQVYRTLPLPLLGSFLWPVPPLYLVYVYQRSLCCVPLVSVTGVAVVYCLCTSCTGTSCCFLACRL